jgi:ABC-2 type transport system permease protein
MPIFDQGYQHWSGPLSPHAWRWYTIAEHGVRRGKQNPFLRIMVYLAWMPAIALGLMLCLWGLVERKSELIAPILDWLPFLTPTMLSDPIAYRKVVWTLSFDFFLLTELRFSMILVLIVGPGLISQDLRFNALPLYFSRPVRRIDYFLGKLGVVAYFLGMVLIAPSLIAYLLGLVFSLDLTIIRDTYRILLASIGYGVVMTLSISMLILGMSALTRNSRFVALFWVGIWFVTMVAAQVLMGIDDDQRRRAQAEHLWAVQQNRITHEQERAWQENERERAKKDWRPMVSYARNLSRVGTQMLGTDASWERVAQDLPEQRRVEFLQEFEGPRYPWYWSAIVLLVFFGLSVCILNFRVKSLDRLR